MYQSNRLKSQYSKLACLGELSYGNTISAGIDTYSWDPFEGKPDVRDIIILFGCACGCVFMW